MNKAYLPAALRAKTKCIHHVSAERKIMLFFVNVLSQTQTGVTECITLKVLKHKRHVSCPY